MEGKFVLDPKISSVPSLVDGMFHTSHKRLILPRSSTMLYERTGSQSYQVASLGKLAPFTHQFRTKLIYLSNDNNISWYRKHEVNKAQYHRHLIPRTF